MIDDFPGQRPEVAVVAGHQLLRPWPPGVQQGAGDHEFEIGPGNRASVLFPGLPLALTTSPTAAVMVCEGGGAFPNARMSQNSR